MTKKDSFLFLVVGSLLFFFYRLFDITMILGVDMNDRVLIETHVTYNKSFIFYGKVIGELI
jgi:hypothetical protein